MHYFYLTLFLLSFNAIHASIYSNLKQNVLSLLDELQGDKGDVAPQRRATMRYFHSKKQEDARDKKSALNKANVLRNVRTHEQNLNIGHDMPISKFTGSQDKIGREYFHMDPVLNELRHRRKGIKRRNDQSSSTTNSDEEFWRDQWDAHWLQKKFEALNSTQPRGDVVNMAAARPWGVPCGDPNQHDMPWGSCMLREECDGEYRIYRGDYFCGRTTYVCCALLATNYDMYQGLDLSFAGSSFETDSNEKKGGKNKKKDEKRRREAKKRKRKSERDKRKKKMEKSIRRIVREIRSILTKAYRNGTSQRKKRTKELKRFIEIMKKQYRKDRKSVVDVHEYELVQMDEKLQEKIEKIKGVNENYMTNDTFRNIVVNGTVNKNRLRSFLRVHPELATYFKHRRTGLNLKSGVVALDSKSELEKAASEKDEPESEKKNPKVLDYDVEYGMLYY